MSFVLKGGRVATSEGVIGADVRIAGGRIESVGLAVAREGDEARDVSGMILMPGGIDAHTHFDLPLGGGMRTADDFYTGTRAAIAGGTTCIIDYATQFKGETLEQGLANWHGLADGKCWCDYSFHLAITDWKEDLIAGLPRIFESGVTSFKMYMAYKGSLQVDDGVIYDALKKLKRMGGLLCVHCENGDIIDSKCREILGSKEGALKAAPAAHPLSRPEELETEAVSRLLVTAAMASAPVYVVHVSAGRSMEKIVQAKMTGKRVFAETCPQYLYLDDSLYDLGWESAKYVCSPPLRDKCNQWALWSSIAANLADVVATDHCSFNFATQKERGRWDFTKIPNGMPGVEARMLMLYKGVADGWITLPQMVRVASFNPSRIFGLYPRKGCIAPGADADILVIDPGGTTAISAAAQQQNVDYNPYEGFEVPAAIDSVYLAGRLVRDKKGIQGDVPAGRFVPRGASGMEGV